MMVIIIIIIGSKLARLLFASDLVNARARQVVTVVVSGRLP